MILFAKPICSKNISVLWVRSMVMHGCKVDWPTKTSIFVSVAVARFDGTPIAVISPAPGISHGHGERWELPSELS